MKKLAQNKKFLSLFLAFCLAIGFLFVNVKPTHANPIDAIGSVLFGGDSNSDGSTTSAVSNVIKDNFKAGVDAGANAAVEFVKEPLYNVAKAILIQILIFVSWLLPIASSIFAYIVDANNITKILNAAALYAGWGVVRDTLNIAFILVLVFAAFSTIFQVQNYNLKKLLLNLVLMALLVNFSWPIIRFIIDVSNTMMYTIIKALISNPLHDAGSSLSGIFTKLTEATGIQKIIAPSATALQGKDMAYLIAAIVFVFILGATLLAFSVLMVIRIIALAVLIVFSPIAFVGSIFPTSGNPAGQFWNYLFKYSFFGPIMMFTLYLALTLMKEMTDGRAFDNMMTFSNKAAPMDAGIIAAMAYYVIPVVILWFGMGIAQKMSIIGAENATKFGMGAMGKFTGLNWVKKNYGDYRKERDARKEDARYKAGKKFGQWTNRQQDRLIGAVAPDFLGGASARRRVTTARQAKNREEIKNRSEGLNLTSGDLVTNLNANIQAARDTRTSGANKRTYASEATALRNMQDSELRRAVAAAAGDLNTSLMAAVPTGIFEGVVSGSAAQLGLQAAIADIQAGTASNDQYNNVLSYVRSASGDAVREGINNG